VGQQIGPNAGAFRTIGFVRELWPRERVSGGVERLPTSGLHDRL